MSTDSALIEKREELKRRLAAGEYKTLVDVFLEWFDRVIRKITRQTEPLPIWYTTITVTLLVYLISLVSVFVAGDVTNARKTIDLYRLGYGISFLYAITVGLLPIASTVILKQYIDKIVVFWRDEVLDVTESVTSLDDFQNWLGTVCNRWLNLIVIIIGGSLGGLYLVAQSPKSGFSGYSFTFTTIMVNLFNWNIIYQLIMVLLLSIRLRKYDLKLFPLDPASSELMNGLSNLLSFIVYFVAVFASLFTLTFALAGLFPYLGGSVILFYWVPLIALFVLNQTSISSIIRRAKWKTLNEIQSQVEELRASNNLKDKETMEAINRLMDFHDRVKATRNSALNSGAILSFINSLLLPLLAFLLGNLDKLMALLSQKP